MRRFWLAFLGLILGCPLPIAHAAGEFDAVPKQAVLRVGDREFRPVRAGDGHPGALRRSGKDIVVKARSVTAWRVEDGKQLWKVSLPKGKRFRLLHLNSAIGYFKKERRAKFDYKRPRLPDGPPAVHRLSLRDGSWMEPRRLPGEHDPESPVEEVLAALPDGLMLYILAGAIDRWWEKDGPEEGSWRVVGLKEGEPDWEVRREFREFPPIDVTGFGRLVPLSRAGDRLLVLAGPRENLLTIDPTNGEVDWEAEKLWEYRRGFVGPSVWEFTTERMKEPELPEGGRGEHWPPRIVGGPITVPMGDAFHVFVATATHVRVGGRVRQARLLKLREAWPETVTELPREVDRSKAHPVPGGLVWELRRGDLMRVDASEIRGSRGPGSAGDRIADMRWYRGRSERSPDAWIRFGTDFVDDVVHEETLFRVVEGAWVLSKDERVIHLPVAVFDLRDGTDRRAVLEVPFKGIIVPPEDGTFVVKGNDGWFHYRGNGAQREWAIRDLIVSEDRLEIVVGWPDGKASCFAFPMGDVLGGE